jgi:hypothetical protein
MARLKQNAYPVQSFMAGSSGGRRKKKNINK